MAHDKQLFSEIYSNNDDSVSIPVNSVWNSYFVLA